MSAAAEEIVRAALKEFARAGEHGARIDAIARAAGVNKRLLYHYVGDKAALFEAALGLALDHLGGDGVSGVRERDAWRVLAFAAAGGRPLDLTPLLGSSADAGDPPGRRLALARTALEALLPGLSAALADATESAPADSTGSPSAVRAGRDTPVQVGGASAVTAGKPRIRLKQAPGPP
jgi:AcrR family transcriptional regulator